MGDKIPDGGPAFPGEFYAPEIYRDLYKDLGHHEAAKRASGKSSGMSLRDAFAIAAVRAEWGNGEAMTAEDAARMAYQLADAMIAERERS